MLKAQVITDAVAGGRPMGSGDKQVAEATPSTATTFWDLSTLRDPVGQRIVVVAVVADL